MGLFRRAKGLCPGCVKEKRADVGVKHPKVKSRNLTCTCGKKMKVPIEPDWGKNGDRVPTNRLIFLQSAYLRPPDFQFHTLRNFVESVRIPDTHTSDRSRNSLKTSAQV